MLMLSSHPHVCVVRPGDCADRNDRNDCMSNRGSGQIHAAEQLSYACSLNAEMGWDGLNLPTYLVSASGLRRSAWRLTYC